MGVSLMRGDREICGWLVKGLLIASKMTMSWMSVHHPFISQDSEIIPAPPSEVAWECVELRTPDVCLIQKEETEINSSTFDDQEMPENSRQKSVCFAEFLLFLPPDWALLCRQQTGKTWRDNTRWPYPLQIVTGGGSQEETEREAELTQHDWFKWGAMASEVIHNITPRWILRQRHHVWNLQAEWSKASWTRLHGEKHQQQSSQRWWHQFLCIESEEKLTKE